MKYHQSNQKETAIYLPLPWDRGREIKNSKVMASPGPLTPGKVLSGTTLVTP